MTENEAVDVLSYMKINFVAITLTEVAWGRGMSDYDRVMKTNIHTSQNKKESISRGMLENDRKRKIQTKTA